MRRTVGSLVFGVALLVAAPVRAQAYQVADEGHIVQLVNGTRSSRHVPPLAQHGGLQGMARAQAVRMAERGDIYHNPHLTEDITALGVNWKMVGENVGMGPDADSIYDALLKSQHHYENIVRSNFNYIGVGIVRGSDGRMYLVQVFAEIQPAAVQPKPVAPTRVRYITPPPAPRPAPKPVVTAAPAPRPVVKKPATDPNALVGGVVESQPLPAQPARHAAHRGPSALARLAGSLSFWA